ncbi:MAG: hypothetical protein WC847_01705 [Candidatus Paceibacterota bacterium]|jgi:hypothetical protein
MKSILSGVATITVAMFLVAGASIANAQTPTHATQVQSGARYFRLNTHPQNAGKPIDLSPRKPNWRREIGIVLEHDSPIITLRGENNTESSGILPAGVLVMVDEETKVALWIAVCGNEVVTTGWQPKGKIVSYPEAYEKSCNEMQLVLAKLDSMDSKLDVLVGRQQLTKEDLDAAFAAYVKKNPPPKENTVVPPKGNWYTHCWRDHPWKTFFVHLAAAYIGGRAFGGGDSAPSGQIGGGTTGNGH